ncbi:MAG: hypothetical protein KC912_20600 [Proteobacteria bacterium]|nr:hypothetical protein [Pseudomonadota bacterium]
MRNLWLFAPFALVMACGGTDTDASTADAPTPEPAAEAAPEPAADLGFKVLAPSPLDLAAELKEAGVLDKIEVPAARTSFDNLEDKDRVAFQTGMLFAHTVLGGETVERDAFIAQVKALREGMAALGTGKGLLATMDTAIEQVENDTASRSEFLEELDAQVGMSVPEEGWGPGDTTGPMLQAGAWLAGIELTARAIVAGENEAAADKLLKRPEVAEFFLKYIQEEEGAEKVGMMAGHVSASLTALKAVSDRDAIGLEGASETATITGDLLKRF